MITLTLAMLRSFVADRVAAILTLVAPLAFFSLIALFYQHLEATDGFRFEIAVVDESGCADARLFARSEERRVGKECLRLCRSRWSPYH